MKRDWLDHFLNFVSVILGVSLAFYVSNWSDQQKEKNEIDLIVSSFIDELQLDISTYQDFQIPYNDNQAKIIDEVLQELTTKEIDDSTQIKIIRAFSVNSYRPIDVTFNSINTSGKINLIKDFQLRKDLSKYYQILAVESQNRGEVQVEFFGDQILPWMIENNNLIEPDIASLLGNQVFINQLIVYQSFIQNKNRSYKQLSEEATKLVQRLKDNQN